MFCREECAAEFSGACPVKRSNGGIYEVIWGGWGVECAVECAGEYAVKCAAGCPMEMRKSKRVLGCAVEYKVKC